MGEVEKKLLIFLDVRKKKLCLDRKIHNLRNNNINEEIEIRLKEVSNLELRLNINIRKGFGLKHMIDTENEIIKRLNTKYFLMSNNKL